MKTLISNHEVWRTVLLRLPVGCIPCIKPFDARMSADFRGLAVRAVRSFCNWTLSTPQRQPRVTHHIGPRTLPAGWNHPTYPIPGTNSRYLIEFRSTSFHCFDIVENKLVLAYVHEGNELLGYSLECQKPGCSGSEEIESTKIRVVLTAMYPDM